MTFEQDVIDYLQRLTMAVHTLYLNDMFKSNEHISDFESAIEDMMQRLDKMERKVKKKGKKEEEE